MDIDEIVLSAINPLLSNVWAVDLPAEPEFPAIVYEVETIEEETWVQGGGYNQHTVTVYFFCESRETLKALVKSVADALLALPQYLSSGEAADADFEEQPEVFAYYSTHILRTPNY